MIKRYGLYAGIVILALAGVLCVSGKATAFGTTIVSGSGKFPTYNGGTGSLSYTLTLEPSGWNWLVDFKDTASGFEAQHANANSCGQTFGISPNYAPNNGIRPTWIPSVTIGGKVKGVPAQFKQNNEDVKAVIHLNRKGAFGFPTDQIMLYFYQPSNLPAPAPQRIVIWPTNGIPYTGLINNSADSPGWFFMTY